MTRQQIRVFETALRMAIERSDLTEAEALIRGELERAGYAHGTTQRPG